MSMLFSILFTGLLLGHPLHVSLTSIDINPEQKEALVTCKFYTDDFSLLFYHLYEKNIKPETEKEFTDAELDLINKYMNGSFSMVTGKDTIALEYLRKDQNEESIWLYYKGILPKNKIKTVLLTNKLLLDLYEDQTNLVIITNKLVEKGYTFNYKIRQSELDFHKEFD
jgi:hypothetical protein